MWHTPDGRPPKGGRKPKGSGERITVRLSADASAALETLRAAGLTQTEAIETALIKATSESD